MIEILSLIPFPINLGEIFSNSNMFILAIAIFWLILASIQDFKRREVENWWNFSLIIFVLAFRAFVSVSGGNWWYFAWGLIGLLFGFILHNVFYYARMFGGGDAKMLMALGTLLPLSLDWRINIEIAIIFLLIFLVSGAIYGAVYSLIVMAANFKDFSRAFDKIFKKYKKISYLVELLSIIGFIVSFLFRFYMGEYLMVLLFVSPFLLIWAKAIEESSMKKLVDVKDLTIGDWLAQDIKIGSKKIKPNWEGLSERELKLLQARYKKKVLIKYGAPFIPAFLIALILMLIGFYYGII